MGAQATALEEQIASAAARSETIENFMRNAEQTIKTLDETKTIFLEQVALQKPDRIEAFGILSAEKERHPNDSGSEQSEPEEELEADDITKRIQTLNDEEQFMRMELS